MATYVGIDIAKDHLDISVREVEPPEESSAEPESTQREAFRTKNTAEGRDRLVQRLKKADPTRIVLEASGGLERPVVAAFGAADLPVVVVNPIQTSEFAKSLGRLEKTDALDADVLALFGERVRPELRSLPSEAQQELEALVKRRRQLVEMREAEKNQTCCAIVAGTEVGDSGGEFPSLRREPEVAKPGDVFEHQRVTGQLVAKTVFQDLEDLQLANDVFDQDPFGGVLAVVCFFLFR